MVEKEYQLIIASEPANIAEVEKFVEQLREELEIPDEAYGNILIALTEAVNNCIMHGNKNDKTKSVVITARADDDALVVRAADEGSGFDFEHLPDPTDPQNIEKTTGRGVFLMRQLSESLHYTSGGATVEMRFSLT